MAGNKVVAYIHAIRLQNRKRTHEAPEMLACHPDSNNCQGGAYVIIIFLPLTPSKCSKAGYLYLCERYRSTAIMDQDELDAFQRLPLVSSFCQEQSMAVYWLLVSIL